MTREEIRKIIDNTKVYVNGKSKEIQEKLFSFGYGWGGRNHTEVSYVNEPFLFIYKQNITHSNDMHTFIECKHREITADEILSLEITKPSYRPFRTKDECWEEMQKHQPFGWFRHKHNGYYEPIRVDISNDMPFETLFDNFVFTDGTPFGILEN